MALSGRCEPLCMRYTGRDFSFVARPTFIFCPTSFETRGHLKWSDSDVFFVEAQLSARSHFEKGRIIADLVVALGQPRSFVVVMSEEVF